MGYTWQLGDPSQEVLVGMVLMMLTLVVVNGCDNGKRCSSTDSC